MMCVLRTAHCTCTFGRCATQLFNTLTSFSEALLANASESFTVTVSDGSLSASQTLQINVTAIADTPALNTPSLSERRVDLQFRLTQMTHYSEYSRKSA